jgi:hypothetical protein
MYALLIGFLSSTKHVYSYIDLNLPCWLIVLLNIKLLHIVDMSVMECLTSSFVDIVRERVGSCAGICRRKNSCTLADNCGQTAVRLDLQHF